MKNKNSMFFLFGLVLVLSGCSSNQDNTITDDNNKVIQQNCSQPFVIEGGNGHSLNLKGKVINESIHNVVSNIGGVVKSINCEKGKSIGANSLIATISPDFSDPNIQNLQNQVSMINSQISNVNDIISSTKSNFQTQINSLNIQKSNIESQIKIINDSLLKIDKQEQFGVSDIDKQLESLNLQINTIDTQIQDLTKTKNKLLESKESDLSKLDLNYKNTKQQAKILIGNILVQVDEIYGITNANKHKVETIDIYLGVSDTASKTRVKSDWNGLNEKLLKFENINQQDLSNYLEEINNYCSLVASSIKASVSSTVLSQSSIDSYYAIFIQNGNSIISAKNGLDNVIKSIETVNNSYDNQILALETQINTANNSKKTIESNISNIQDNKIGSYVNSIELQKNELQAQLQTSNSTLKSLNSQIDSILSQQDIQLTNFNTQLKQLQTSLDNVNLNLTSQSVYSKVKGVVKEKLTTVGNKVGPSVPICQIIPSESNLKLQIYSSKELILPLDIEFSFDNKTYKTQLITKLPYQDSVTQNYIYETDTNVSLDGKNVILSEILSDGKLVDVVLINPNLKTQNNNEIKIPVNYVFNSIQGSYVNLKNNDGNITNHKIILGELDSDKVIVRSGLEFGDEICK